MTTEPALVPSIGQSFPTDSVQPILSVAGLRHELGNGNGADRYSIEVDKLVLPLGKFVGLLGPNACGKTTLLTILGLLQKPQCKSNGEAVRAGSSSQMSFRLHRYDFSGGIPTRETGTHDLLLAWRGKTGVGIQQLRREHLGFALQTGELLPSLNVLQNIEMPLRLNGKSKSEARKEARELLRILGNPHTANDIPPSERGQSSEEDDENDLLRVAKSLPSQLAGSQYQRVVIARAIAHRPQIVFVDEPTNSLARGTARRALRALKNQMQERGMTVVMITHDIVLADEFCEFVVCMDYFQANSGYVKEFYRKEGPGVWWRVDAKWRRCEEGPFPAIPTGWNPDDHLDGEEKRPVKPR